MELGIIYVATNKINGKQYVGQTQYPINKRLKEHIKDAKRSKNSVFHKAIIKYGIGAFIIEVHEFPLNQLNEKEQEFIRKLKSNINGYNLTEGGGGTKGFKHKPESKVKMATMKGKKFSPEHRLKIAASHTGKKHTENTKKKYLKVKQVKKFSLLLKNINKICAKVV